MNLKNFDSAIKYFNHCVKLKNDYSPALNNLGLALVSKGDIEVGIKYFQKALNIDKNNQEAYLNLGNAYFSLKKFEKAQKTFNLLLKINLTVVTLIIILEIFIKN